VCRNAVNDLYRNTIQRLSDKQRSILSTTVLSAALLAYSNVDAWLELRATPAAVRRVNYSHLSVLAFVLAWGWAERLKPQDLGVHVAGIGRSLGWGLLSGIAGSVVVSLFFAFPLVTRESVTHPEVRGLNFRKLLWMLGGQMLLSTAVFEEITFRGVLQAKLSRLVGPRQALLIGSALFAAWHIVVTSHNLRRSNLPRRLFTVLFAGAMGMFWVAGLLFGLLRERTNHLAGGILAHWLIVSNIVVSVARPRRRN
jgi:membrane protease YdiL (CAAX protease family)